MDPFNAISEPNRRRLLDALSRGPKTVNQLVTEIGMSQPVVSKHLKLLKDAALVAVHPDGQRRYYALDDQGFNEIHEWLSTYRSFMSERLDNLDKLLNKLEG